MAGNGKYLSAYKALGFLILPRLSMQCLNVPTSAIVNNALYSLSTENTGAVDVKTMPPMRVLDGYPDLFEKFAGIVDFAKDTNPALKTFIQVPFKDKDDAKELGAKWDRQAQSWYVPAGVAIVPFEKWTQASMPPTDNAPDTATVQTQDNNPVPY